MASFSAGTTFTDGVANDVTAAKLGALVNNATPTSGLIQDRTAETITATNDTLLIGDASDSNNLKRITVANFAQTLPTAKVTTGTIGTATLGTTTGTAATFTTGTITTLTAGTTTSTAATITTGTITTGVIPTLTSTTLITSGTGTAAAPAIVPTGDTNTGIFFPAADTIAFSEGGTESMRINSSGNVGIGVTNPLVKLHINGVTRIGSGNDYQFDSTLKISAESTGATGYLRFYTDSTERLRIDSSGNVGIGTTSPAAKLTVSGTNGTNSELRVVSTGANTGGRVTLYESTSGCWEFATSGGANSALTVKDLFNNTERLRIDSSGNVGIGTTSPTDAKLSVYANNLTIPAIAARSSAAGYKMGFGLYNVLGYPYLGLNCNQVTSSNNQTYDLSAHATKLDMSIDGSTPGFVFSTAASGTAGSAITWSERLRIDSSGFVSIGTATALSALHVHGNVTLSNTTTATSAGTGGLSKPATYAGYLTVSINGTSRKIPYYAT